jgi:thymidylate synthase (FAD)
MLIDRGHTAMLEHGTVYLTFGKVMLAKYLTDKYSKVNKFDDTYYVTTNYRVLQENNWLYDIDCISNKTKHHEPRITVKFCVDRGISHELVRHRIFSFAQESTRYCNYSKDKFDNELTFIIPNWIDDLEERSYCAHAEYHHTKSDVNKQWFDVMMNADFVYEDLIRDGWQPQQARSILPNSLKTEVIMTGFLSDWIGKVSVYDKERETYCNVQRWCPSFEEDIRKTYNSPDYRIYLEGFFPLRTAKSAHPQMREVAIPLYEMFKKEGLV